MGEKHMFTLQKNLESDGWWSWWSLFPSRWPLIYIYIYYIILYYIILYYIILYYIILYCDLPHQLAGWKHIEIYGRSKADVSQVQGFLGLVTICLVVFRLKNMRKVSDDEWWTIYHSQDFWIKECSKPPSSCTWWVNKLTTSKPRENPLVIELRGTPQIVIILET